MGVLANRISSIFWGLGGAGRPGWFPGRVVVKYASVSSLLKFVYLYDHPAGDKEVVGGENALASGARCPRNDRSSVQRLVYRLSGSCLIQGRFTNDP